MAVALVGGCGGGGGGDGGEATNTTAPETARIDRGQPTFTNPTAITNPLLPAGTLSEAVLVGTSGSDEVKFGHDQVRIETSRLPGARSVALNGQKLSTVISQVITYRNGRVAEVSLDLLAQADDGSVWALGEDVANYKDGKLVDNEGTWIAGKGQGPAMVMPTSPKIGDVFRPEDVKGADVVEATVKDTGLTVDGPRGPIGGAVLIREKGKDGSVEDKTYAPGYGLVQSKVDARDEQLAIAVAVPTDATPGGVPAPLTALSAAADELGSLKAPADWAAASGSVDRLAETWKAYSAGAVSKPLRAEVDEDLTTLRDAVASKKLNELHQAAIGIGVAGLDLQLQFRPQADVDRARASLSALQLKVDAEAKDLDAVKSDIVTLDSIWARSSYAFGRDKVRAQRPLDEIRTVSQLKHLPAAATSASAFRARLAGN